MVRIFLEILDIWDIHSCAWTWSAIVIVVTVEGSFLSVSSSRGSFVKETSCEISASVLTWKAPVRLMTMGMILTSALRVPYVCSACRSGS